jgi:hypothetical protein
VTQHRQQRAGLTVPAGVTRTHAHASCPFINPLHKRAKFKLTTGSAVRLISPATAPAPGPPDSSTVAAARPPSRNELARDLLVCGSVDALLCCGSAARVTLRVRVRACNDVCERQLQRPEDCSCKECIFFAGACGDRATPSSRERPRQQQEDN